MFEKMNQIDHMYKNHSFSMNSMLSLSVLEGWPWRRVKMN